MRTPGVLARTFLSPARIPWAWFTIGGVVMVFEWATFKSEWLGWLFVIDAALLLMYCRPRATGQGLITVTGVVWLLLLALVCGLPTFRQEEDFLKGFGLAILVFIAVAGVTFRSSVEVLKHRK